MVCSRFFSLLELGELPPVFSTLLRGDDIVNLDCWRESYRMDGEGEAAMKYPSRYVLCFDGNGRARGEYVCFGNGGYDEATVVLCMCRERVVLCMQ